MLPVIHFSTLSELLDEFNGERREIVRVSHHQRTETKPGRPAPYTVLTIQVNVRALYQGAILSYVAFSQEIRDGILYNRDEARAKYEAAWDAAQKVKWAICAEIRAAGHEPRPGIIDLGGVQPVVGEQWPLSEVGGKDDTD